MHGIKKIAIDTDMTLFSFDAVATVWTAFVAFDPPLSALVAPFAGTVIDHFITDELRVPALRADEVCTYSNEKGARNQVRRQIEHRRMDIARTLPLSYMLH